MKAPKTKESSPSRATAEKSAAITTGKSKVKKSTAPVSLTSRVTGVPLKLIAPTAKDVSVAGTFNGWQAGAICLKPARNGEWSGEVKLAPGRYEYLFVVDGKWLPDPAAPEAVPNPFGGLNSVVSIG